MRLEHAGLVGFVLLAVLTCALGAAQWLSGKRPSSDLLDLLPPAAIDAVEQQAATQMNASLARELIVLIGGIDDPDRLAQIAQSAADELDASGVFAPVTLKPDVSLATIGETLLAHRLALMPESLVQSLAQTGAQPFLDHRLQELYTGFAAAGVVSFEQDITGLANASLPPSFTGHVSLDPSSGLLAAIHDDALWVLLRLETRADAYQLDQPERAVAAVETVRARVQAEGGKLLAAGGAFHAADARAQAEHELESVGSVSLVGTLVLIVLAFRRLRALIALVPAIFGFVAGSVATVAAFGSIHVLTIVLGTSLIGVSVDYGLHYMSDAYHHKGPWEPWRAMANVRTPLALGLMTSVTGYASIGLAPFPALQQLSLFSAVGLIASFLAVVLAMPAFLHGFSAGGDNLLLRVGRLLLRVRAHLHGRRAQGAGLVLVMLLIPGLFRLQTSDDVRSLIHTRPERLAEDQQVQAITGIKLSSAFFLIEGKNEAQTLQRERAFAQTLQEAAHRGLLGEFSALGAVWQPSEVQQARKNLLLQTLFAPASQTWWTDGLGVEPEVVQANREALERLPPATLEDFLQSPLGAPFRDQWLGPTPRGFASVIRLNDVADPDAMHALAASSAGVRWVDRVAQISDVMGQTRRLAGGLTALACVFMTLLLLPRYGLKDAVRVISAPVAGVLSALSIMGWLGIPINMFGTFGLVLLIATGVDYAIYFRESSDDPSSTMLGVLLDTLTTLLSFGALILSRTPAVQSFGSSIALGVVLCFVLAPWVRPLSPEDLERKAQAQERVSSARA